MAKKEKKVIGMPSAAIVDGDNGAASDGLLKIFSDHYSVVQNEDKIIGVIQMIGGDKFDMGALFSRHKTADFEDLREIFLHDDTKGKKVFDKIINEDVKRGIDLLKEFKGVLERKYSTEVAAREVLQKQKEEQYSLWSGITEEKERLETEKEKMAAERDDFLKKRNWLISKKEYVNYKLKEYGDEKKINELFEALSKEYESEKAEEASLKEEYDKAISEEKTLPRLCADIEREMKGLREDMDRTKYEMQEILKAFPDMQKQGKESEELVLKYRAVHKDLEESSSALKIFNDNFSKVDAEVKETGETLSVKKEELAPFLKTEESLKNELAELTNRFSRQEELKEEKRVFEDAVKPISKSVEEWKEKIKNHEAKLARMNKETEDLKNEGLKMASEIKECEALVGPVMELKEKLEGAEKEISRIAEQDKTLTEQIRMMRKENEVLSIKARQFEMIKQKLGGIK
jgi:predicted  nucleic acid-binding Zn-ribbon protein